MKEQLDRLAAKAKEIVKNPIMQRAMLCAVLLGGPACGEREQARVFGSNIDIGPLPDDICIVNGEPRIINVSTQSDGEVNLVYIGKNGKVIIGHYTHTANFGTSYERKGSSTFSGSVCPSSSSQR